MAVLEAINGVESVQEAAREAINGVEVACWWRDGEVRWRSAVPSSRLVAPPGWQKPGAQ